MEHRRSTGLGLLGVNLRVHSARSTPCAPSVHQPPSLAAAPLCPGPGWNGQQHVAMSASSSNDKSAVPANLRFQRRTSERAFYEGAFKPAMDYSAAISSDPDLPAGSSPWASNSPQHNRNSFGVPSNNDVSSGTLSSSTPYGASANGHDSVDHLDRPSTSGSDALATSENGDSINSPYQPQAQSYPQHQAPGQHPSHQQRQYQQQQQQQQSVGYENNQPQRYHNPRLQAQQQQQQPQRPSPQYKLQVKISGLERSGRKDAVFVFDAYVCPCTQLLFYLP